MRCNKQVAKTRQCTSSWRNWWKWVKFGGRLDFKQLLMVVYTIIYLQVFYTSQVVQDFFHQQNHCKYSCHLMCFSCLWVPCWKKTTQGQKKDGSQKLGGLVGDSNKKWVCIYIICKNDQTCIDRYICETKRYWRQCIRKIKIHIELQGYCQALQHLVRFQTITRHHDNWWHQHGTAIHTSQVVCVKKVCCNGWCKTW